MRSKAPMTQAAAKRTARLQPLRPVLKKETSNNEASGSGSVVMPRHNYSTVETRNDRRGADGLLELQDESGDNNSIERTPRVRSRFADSSLTARGEDIDMS